MDDLRYQVDLLTAINQRLTNNEQMYKAIIETSKRAFVYVNYSTNVIRTLGRWDAFFDFKISEICDFSQIVDAFSEEGRDELHRILFLEKNTNENNAVSEVKLGDERTWILVNASLQRDEYGNAVEKVISFTDITKNHINKDELTYLAYYDSLTGLYNRNFFITQLKEWLDKAAEKNDIVSIMLLDVDDFHKISDSRGILAGDEVVQNIGLYIHSLLDNNIIASRFDRDIFCVAIYDPCGNRSVDSIYHSIRDFLSNPIRLVDSTELSTTVSVGVAEYPEASDNVLQLINYAEIVMLKAKSTGKDSIKFFDSEILTRFLSDVTVESKLQEALLKGYFSMNYQPQFYADSQKLRGVEALVRWTDPDGTVISPGVFIPLAEKNGTIIQIGDFVLEESIKTFMEWKKRYEYKMTLSINISSIQYNRPDFVPKVISIINKYGMDPEELELEITESVLIDDFRLVTTKMYELGDYGIKVSLDDFGTGFSSLSYLKGLPIDTLKIDKSFIDNVTTDEASRVITETIITMAKKLGFITVAEGVETRSQLEYLQSVSCNLIQGYYLGRPMEKERIEEILLRLM